jgi:hypothetical protein
MDGARNAWASGLATLPNGVAQVPDEMGERAALLERLGRTAEARPLAAKLNSIGYRLPM